MGPAETARRADGSYHSVLPIGRATVGDLEVLQGLAAELASVVDARPRLAARAERLARRLAEGRFHVVVLGEFNRGKSTLVKWAWCRSPRSSPRSPMANPIEGTADAAMSSAKVVGGVLADRPGVDRKELTAAGYGITALGHGAFAFANAWPFVAVARAVSWTARGGKAPARDSLLSGSVPHHQLGSRLRRRAGDGLPRADRRTTDRGSTAAGDRVPLAVRGQRHSGLACRDDSRRIGGDPLRRAGRLVTTAALVDRRVCVE